MNSEQLLVVLKKNQKNVMRSIHSGCSEKRLEELFSSPMVMDFLNSKDYQDENFLYKYFPATIRANQNLINYYYSKPYVFHYLPNTLANKPEVICHFVSKDPLIYCSLNEDQKDEIKYLIVAAQALKETYDKYIKDNVEIENFSGLYEEQKYLLENIPRELKKKINVLNMKRENIEDLYKIILEYADSTFNHSIDNLVNKTHKNVIK